MHSKLDETFPDLAGKIRDFSNRVYPRWKAANGCKWFAVLDYARYYVVLNYTAVATDQIKVVETAK